MRHAAIKSRLSFPRPRNQGADAPRVLPSTLELQILLLPSPVYSPNAARKLQVFVSELSGLLGGWIDEPV
jgi:hypothetical protein